jgi:hypothetical protein
MMKVGELGMRFWIWINIWIVVRWHLLVRLSTTPSPPPPSPGPPPFVFGRRQDGMCADEYGVEWNTIAELIEENWAGYDGFIILSGTDTLVIPPCLLSSIPYIKANGSIG